MLDSGAPSCLSLLWSVTDRDIDRYTLRLYADWFSGERQSGEPGPNLGRYIVESEKACKLGPLNGGAVVNYGLLPNCIRVPQNWDAGLPKDINYHPETIKEDTDVEEQSSEDKNVEVQSAEDTNVEEQSSEDTNDTASDQNLPKSLNE